MEAADAEPPKWQPYTLDEVATIGSVGRWLDAAVDFIGDWPKQDERALMEFPHNWPAVFKESVRLRTLVNKRLRGTRCRAVEPATAADKVLTKSLTLRPLHSFQNAVAISEVLGWRLVKGFMIYECNELSVDESGRPISSNEPAADGVFVALRHWWNAREDGAWVDLTPPATPLLPGREQRTLLVESERGEKHATALTPRSRQHAVAAADRIIRHGATALCVARLNHSGDAWRLT